MTQPTDPLSPRGSIFNIERFSTHNGPGVRSTVFLKGCPLSCIWCHNPEGLDGREEVYWARNLCRHCGICVRECPEGAIQVNTNGEIVTDRALCTACGKCIEVCPVNARTLFGRCLTPKEVLDEVKKDSVFYDESGGGVTFSGGEPLSQINFLVDCLKLCHSEGFHICLDTSGYAPKSFIEKISPFVNLFLYDVKIIDDSLHKKFTGVSNELILANLRYVDSINKSIWARIPIIPTINDSYENLRMTAEILKNLENLERVNLLPFHKIGSEKYLGLSKEYEAFNYDVPEDEIMEEYMQIFKEKGLNVKLGG